MSLKSRDLVQMEECAWFSITSYRAIEVEEVDRLWSSDSDQEQKCEELLELF